MTKKQEKICASCIHKDGVLCSHKSNKGIIVKYRTETPVYFKTCAEINENGNCENYAEFSAE